jgi:raffinose/stachyose/melibiose transport system permease protein
VSTNHVLHKRSTVVSLVSPGILVMVFAIVAPILLSVYYSLTDWAGFGDKTFIGLGNYAEILRDQTFWRSLLNALILLIVSIAIQSPLALIVAATLLNLSPRFSQVLRTIYFVPAILTVVVVAKIWVNLLNPQFGLVNKLFAAMGLAELSDVVWLADPRTALISVLFMMNWHGFGWALLFFYAGLTTVPTEFKEAAVVDGANRFQVFRHVIIPSMWPVIQAIVIIDITSALKQMEMVFLTTSGGPGNRTEFVAHYMYRQAFFAARFGYGNAISVVFVFLALSVTVLARRYSSRVYDL